jgi:hypothetical protein
MIHVLFYLLGICTKGYLITPCRKNIVIFPKKFRDLKYFYDSNPFFLHMCYHFIVDWVTNNI